MYVSKCIRLIAEGRLPYFFDKVFYLMRATTNYLLLTTALTIAIASCDKKSSENQKVNQLYITDEGDSLETGFWIFEPGASGVRKYGNFKDGFRDGAWTYRTKTDSTTIKWMVWNMDSLKLNLPDYVARKTESVALNLKSLTTSFTVFEQTTLTCLTLTTDNTRRRRM